MRRPAALCFAGAIGILGIAAMASATAAGTLQPAPARIEARSADLLAVGVVQDDRMNIHLSRLLDNAPVRDVAVTVLLRGVAHPTTAEADGGFTLQTPDLRLPGTAGVEFQIAGGAAHETLKGVLQVAAGAGNDRAGSCAGDGADYRTGTHSRGRAAAGSNRTRDKPGSHGRRSADAGCRRRGCQKAVFCISASVSSGQRPAQRAVAAPRPE